MRPIIECNYPGIIELHLFNHYIVISTKMYIRHLYAKSFTRSKPPKIGQHYYSSDSFRVKGCIKGSVSHGFINYFFQLFPFVYIWDKALRTIGLICGKRIVIHDVSCYSPVE